MPSDSGEDIPERRRMLAKVRETIKLANSTVERVRRVATELRPGLLDDFGLIAAIEWQAQQFQEQTGVQFELVLNTPRTNFPPSQSTAMFRIVQEALTNVTRHARAAKVTITLEEENQTLVLRLQDDGRGADEAELSGPRALGVLGMKERARLAGGNLKITSEPGAGTTITVIMPLAITDT